MKNFKILLIALVAMCGLNSCSDDCNHEFFEVDYSKALVGTWTLVNEGFAEAWVIKEDGSVEVTGVLGGEYYETKGTIKLKNNKMSYKLDDGSDFEGILDIIPGKCFSMTYADYPEFEYRMAYEYCANDLADELIGMWVCNDSKMDAQNDMMIQTFDANGKTTLTGFLPMEDNPEFVLNDKTDYKVVGDLMFLAVPAEFVGGDKPMYIAEKLIYSPVASTLGDVMIFTNYSSDNSELMSETWFRIKQSLNLAGKAYDYNNTYVSNVKGLDEDMTMMGYTFNIAKMEGKNLDKMLKTLLFAVEFPTANTIKYQYHYNGLNLVFEAPIVVDGNKVTIKMSELSTYYRDVDMYMFQDQDNTQLHMYMPTYAFINYFANMDLAALTVTGDIDLTDESAVKAIFDRMDERVESINVSFIFKTAK